MTSTKLKQRREAHDDRRHGGHGSKEASSDVNPVARSCRLAYLVILSCGSATLSSNQ